MNCVERKILVVDTSVLLYDKNSIFNFKSNDVYIPLVVLEELDKFKDRPGCQKVAAWADILAQRLQLAEAV